MGDFPFPRPNFPSSEGSFPGAMGYMYGVNSDEIHGEQDPEKLRTTALDLLHQTTQLRGRNLQLEAENAELRASLKECVEYAERYEDSGPFGEGWQSERLVKACQRARALLARVEGK